MKPHLILSPTPAPQESSGTTVAVARNALAPLASGPGPQTRGPGPQTRIPVGAEANVCRQPQVTVLKQGSEVTAIEVLCSCGERITIELQY